MKRNKLILICILYSGLMGFIALTSHATDEISVTASLQVDNGNFKLQRQVNAYKVTQVGVAADMGIMTVTNSLTNVVTTINVKDPRYCFFRNLSTNNALYVTCTIRLDANDVALLPVATTNLTTYTTNGYANLEYWINQK